MKKKMPVQSSKRRKKNTLTIIGTSKKQVFDCVFRRSFLDRQTTRHLRSRLILTRMSQEVSKWFINGLINYNLLINGVYWVYSPLIRSPLIRSLPTGHPNRVFSKKLFENQGIFKTKRPLEDGTFVGRRSP